MMEAFFFVILAMGIAALSIWAFLLQSGRKAKILVIVISLYALAQGARDIYSFVIPRPEPSLVLTEIEEHYDGDPPTAFLFLPNVKNTGDAVATNVRTKFQVYIGGKLVANEDGEQPDLKPGQTVRLRAWLKGGEFATVWNEQSKLRIVVEVSYASKSGKQYSQSFEGNYSPHPDEPIPHSGQQRVSATNLATGNVGSP